MKLVIYNKQNSQPVGQRNGERTLRFNRENGMIYYLIVYDSTYWLFPPPLHGIRPREKFSTTKVLISLRKTP